MRADFAGRWSWSTRQESNRGEPASQRRCLTLVAPPLLASGLARVLLHVALLLPAFGAGLLVALEALLFLVARVLAAGLTRVARILPLAPPLLALRLRVTGRTHGADENEQRRSDLDPGSHALLAHGRTSLLALLGSCRSPGERASRQARKLHRAIDELNLDAPTRTVRPQALQEKAGLGF